MSPLHRLLRQPRARRRLAVQALFWVLVVRLGLPLLGYARLCRLLPRTRRPTSSACLADVQWAVLAVTSRLPGTNCLARSLATAALLGRAGIDHAIRFGVAKPDSGGLQAHAWVECEGRPVYPEDLSRYAPLAAGKP